VGGGDTLPENNTNWLIDRITKCVYYASCLKPPERCEACVLREHEVIRPWAEEALTKAFNKACDEETALKFNTIMDKLCILVTMSKTEYSAQLKKEVIA